MGKCGSTSNIFRSMELYKEGLTSEEIAAQMGLTKSTVLTYLKEARRWYRKHNIEIPKPSKSPKQHSYNPPTTTKTKRISEWLEGETLIGYLIEIKTISTTFKENVPIVVVDGHNIFTNKILMGQLKEIPIGTKLKIVCVGDIHKKDYKIKNFKVEII